MGAIETTSRIIIAKINETENVAAFNAALAKRLEYLSVRLNLADVDKKAKAINLFDTLNKLVKFRNSAAQSGIVYKEVDGVKIPAGLMNFTRDDPENIGAIISIEELWS